MEICWRKTEKYKGKVIGMDPKRRTDTVTVLDGITLWNSNNWRDGHGTILVEER